jgi:hypothetical protein
MAGSTTSIPMSPGYGGYQATAVKEQNTTSPHYYTTSTYATPTYYAEPPSTTSQRLQIITLKLCCTELLHRSPEVLLCPELRHQIARVLRWGSRVLHWGSQVLHHQSSRVLHYSLRCSSLLYWCSQLLHRGSGLLHHQIGRILHRSAQVLHCNSATYTAQLTIEISCVRISDTPTTVVLYLSPTAFLM